MAKLILGSILAFLGLGSFRAFAISCELRLLTQRYAQVAARQAELGVITDAMLVAVVRSKVPVTPFKGIYRTLENGRAIDFYEDLLTDPEVATNWPKIQAELSLVMESSKHQAVIGEDALAKTAAVFGVKEFPVNLPVSRMRNKWLRTRDGRLLYAEGENLKLRAVWDFVSGSKVWEKNGAGVGPYGGLREAADGKLQVILFEHQPQSKLRTRLYGQHVVRSVWDPGSEQIVSSESFDLNGYNSELPIYHPQESGLDFVDIGFTGYGILAGKGYVLPGNQLKFSEVEGVHERLLLYNSDTVNGIPAITINSIGEHGLKPLHAVPAPENSCYIQGAQMGNGKFAIATSRKLHQPLGTGRIADDYDRDMVFFKPSLGNFPKGEIIPTGGGTLVLGMLRSPDDPNRALVVARVALPSGEQIQVWDPEHNRWPIFTAPLSNMYASTFLFVERNQFYLVVAEEEKRFRIYNPLAGDTEIGEFETKEPMTQLRAYFPNQGRQAYLIGEVNGRVQAYSLFSGRTRP